jgi:hypothetical protein
VSWEQAKRDAEKWLNMLNFKRPAPGEIINLKIYSQTLPHTGKQREMVINAIRRNLKARGIKAILPE